MSETDDRTETAPITAAFVRAKAEHRVALMPYAMAGYPDEATSEELIVAMAAAGADVIEFGAPFSDPLADGATIQHASQQALDGGMTLARALALAKRAITRMQANTQNDQSAPPLVLMGYYNPIFSYGIARFCADASAAGLAGLIVPDLPPEEAETLRSAAAAQGLELNFLVTPTSPQERIAQAAAMAGKTGGGFVYCVSLSGVTGARDHLPEELGAFLARVRAATDLPLAVGFGVSRPEHVAEIGRLGANGAVVASAIINIVDAAAPDQRIPAVVAFLRSLQEGAK